MGLSKRRVYVMDCGCFVKIGVSGNVESRKNQIPFKVNQYYCTNPIENAFEIEKMAHKRFSAFRADNVKGHEYFEIDFNLASNYVRELTDVSFAKDAEEKKKEKILKELFSCTEKLSITDISFVLGIVQGICISQNKLNLSDIL